MAASSDTSPLHELKQFIRTCPVIDNHGHNLLRLQGLKTEDFLTITSEATGRALADTPTSLAHLRAVRQLRDLYNLPADAGWPAILKKRDEWLHDDPNSLTKKCLEGTQTILVDDGLADDERVEPYAWHDKYTLSPCKRIVRIETLGADILAALHQRNQLPVGAAITDGDACGQAWLTFMTAFEQALAVAIEEPDIVGFKSVICYRTGLDIRMGQDVDVLADGLRAFRKHFLPDCVSRKFRIDSKGMNDALVITTCRLIRAGYRERDISKPFQFHTGLGDNDISLLDSNPGCLQPLIEAFPTVPFVLLHSSYPYTREAGYLATVYRNCYLDIGEVFPMVSRDGQEKIIRQALELTPWSKLLWSTDGHYFPETYWLANLQGRQAIEKVLCEYVEQEDLTVSQALQAAQAILFENSNWLYDLRLSLDKKDAQLPERSKDSQWHEPSRHEPAHEPSRHDPAYEPSRHEPPHEPSPHEPAYESGRHETPHEPSRQEPAKESSRHEPPHEPDPREPAHESSRHESQQEPIRRKSTLEPGWHVPIDEDEGSRHQTGRYDAEPEDYDDRRPSAEVSSR